MDDEERGKSSPITENADAVKVPKLTVRIKSSKSKLNQDQNSETHDEPIKPENSHQAKPKDFSAALRWVS